MVDENEQSKDLYAHFGLAMYMAQVFEYGVIGALVALRLPQKEKYSRENIDAFIEGRYEKTLGALLKHLRAEMKVSDELEPILEKALKRRNYLAHHYFRERSEPLQTIDGRNDMIVELLADVSLFQEADGLLTEAIQPIRDKHGVSRERGEEIWAEYCAKLGIVP
jgi:hypothetical protein